jgi:hypothetical protein
MRRKNNDAVSLISACVAFIGLSVSLTFGQTTTSSSVVRSDVFAATTSDQFLAAYNNSKNKTDKIAALSALPRAVKLFNVNVQTAAPAWLSAILNDALNSTDPDVVQKAVEQVGNSGLFSFADALIYLYGQGNPAPQDLPSIVLHTKIIRSLGNLGTPSTITLLGSIIDAHLVRPETDEAFGAIGRLCATSLIPNINNYIQDLQTKLNNNTFVMNDPTKKPLVPPEGSLSIALSAVQMLGSGNCGK